MKYIIPAKAASKRVPNKNWRPFYGDDSLVDILLGKLIAAGAEADKIYVSCDLAEVAVPTCERWGVQFLQRSPDLCDNSVPLTTWIRAICGQVPGEDNVAWCQVCDPMFAEYAAVFELAERSMSGNVDSVVVNYPWRGYLMTERSQPIGWSFGEHHTPSQKLPAFRTMPFTLSVLSREAIAATGYHVGRKPVWFLPTNEHIDIDTEHQFRVAQLMYSELFRRTVEHR